MSYMPASDGSRRAHNDVRTNARAHARVKTLEHHVKISGSRASCCPTPLAWFSEGACTTAASGGAGAMRAAAGSSTFLSFRLRLSRCRSVCTLAALPACTLAALWQPPGRHVPEKVVRVRSD